MAEREYTISHTGSVLGADKVTLSQNQVAPQMETEVVAFEGPGKFENINYNARRDAVRFVPRTVEEATGTTGDDTTINLTADIQPVHGESKIADQDYPVVVAKNVTSGAVLDVVDVDYAANTITLGTDPASGDTVKVWPIVTEGVLKWEGYDNLGRSEGVVAPFGFPIYRFHDFRQLQAGREINMHGEVDWGQYDTLKLQMDSPRQLVWEDADYPDAYVSTLEVDVEITI